MRKSELQEIIKELIQRELDEINSTSNIDGGAGPPKTPAWVSKKKKGKGKRQVIFSRIVWPFLTQQLTLFHIFRIDITVSIVIFFSISDKSNLFLFS